MNNRCTGYDRHNENDGFNRVAVGVDVGGTKIAVGLVTCGGTILHYSKHPTPKNDPLAFKKVIISSIKDLLELADCDLSRLSGIGIGVPGVLSHDKRVIRYAPNIGGLKEFPLAATVEKEIGYPTVLGYDGHVIALAEQWVGAGRHCGNLIVVAVGTGVGGGIISNNRIIEGDHGIAGAFGWMMLSERCGHEVDQSGWLEDRVAGPAILTHANRLKRYSTTEEVFLKAQRGEKEANQVLEEIGRLLGRAISTIASSLDISHVVLAGGVGSQCGMLLPRIRAEVHKFGQPEVRQDLSIQLAQLGSKAGVVGSARLALDPRNSLFNH
jgi:glucokinase